MIDPPTPDDSWFKWLAGVGIALLGFIGKKIIGLFRSFVTRDELAVINAERMRMHEENRAALERIEEQLTRVHTRVDDVWKKVPWSP